MRQYLKNSVINYGFALVCVAAALAISYYYHPLWQRGVLQLFLAAIALAAWRGGFGPAMLALVVCSFVTAWWIFAPADSLRVSNSEDIVRLCVFVFIALLISYLHTARARAEKSARESDLRLGFALDSSGVGCWDVDVPAGRFWNSPNLPAIYGRSPADFATTYEGFFAYIHPEDRDFFRLASVHPRKTGRDYQISHRIICADGSIRLVDTRGRMYLDETGKVIRMVGAVYNIEHSLSESQSGVSEPGRNKLARSSV